MGGEIGAPQHLINLNSFQATRQRFKAALRQKRTLTLDPKADVRQAACERFLADLEL